MPSHLMSLLSRLGAPDAATRPLVHKAWRKLTLRNLTLSDNHSQLDRLYALPDPWDMASAREQARFRQTNAILESRAGRVGSILEIGCGEGHQSEHLATLCDQLYAIDVSERAVSRARERVPSARMAATSIDSLPWAPPDGRFDVVVACEVLYYVRDIPATLTRMSALGRTCIVTFFAPAARVVASHLDGIPDLERGWIYHAPEAWLWAAWRNRDTQR